MRLLAHFIVVSFLFFSCKKNKVIPPEPMPPFGDVAYNSSLKLKITNVANGQPLVLGNTTYTTLTNDTFSVNIFQYYFTNISLTNSSGQTYNIPGSYFLIDQADSTSGILNLKNLPAGDYTSINFMIGVDSLKNVTGANTGALDAVHGLYWGWNSGYIMAKVEGHSPQSGSALKNITFHIGGYAGSNKGIRLVSLALPINAHVHEEHQTQINLNADVAKWFSGTNTIDFSTTYDVVNINSRSKSIADNYANMFTVTSVIN